MPGVTDDFQERGSEDDGMGSALLEGEPTLELWGLQGKTNRKNVGKEG